jgi:hypothetical protein
MASVNASGFTHRGQQYVNAAWDERQPHLDITVDLGLGSLNLERNRPIRSTYARRAFSLNC